MISQTCDSCFYRYCFYNKTISSILLDDKCSRKNWICFQIVVVISLMRKRHIFLAKKVNKICQRFDVSVAFYWRFGFQLVSNKFEIMSGSIKLCILNKLLKSFSICCLDNFQLRKWVKSYNISYNTFFVVKLQYLKIGKIKSKFLRKKLIFFARLVNN